MVTCELLLGVILLACLGVRFASVAMFFVSQAVMAHRRAISSLEKAVVSGARARRKSGGSPAEDILDLSVHSSNAQLDSHTLVPDPRKRVAQQASPNGNVHTALAHDGVVPACSVPLLFSRASYDMANDSHMANDHMVGTLGAHWENGTTYSKNYIHDGKAGALITVPVWTVSDTAGMGDVEMSNWPVNGGNTCGSAGNDLSARGPGEHVDDQSEKMVTDTDGKPLLGQKTASSFGQAQPILSLSSLIDTQPSEMCKPLAWETRCPPGAYFLPAPDDMSNNHKSVESVNAVPPMDITNFTSAKPERETEWKSPVLVSVPKRRTEPNCESSSAGDFLLTVDHQLKASVLGTVMANESRSKVNCFVADGGDQASALVNSKNTNDPNGNEKSEDNG